MSCFRCYFCFCRRLSQVLGNAKPLRCQVGRRFCISLVYRGDAQASGWLPQLEHVPQGSRPVFSRSFPGRFWCFFGSFWVSGLGFGSLFSLRPSGLPFPPRWVFRSARFGRVFLFFVFFAVLLHLASSLFWLGKLHCRKPGCNDPGPCRPSI